MKSIAQRLVALVAKVYRVQAAKIIARSRKHSDIRHQCMWLLRSVANASVTGIAAFFKRSKSTVSAAIGKVQDLLRTDGVPSIFNFKYRLLWLLCKSLSLYLRAIAVPLRQQKRLRSHGMQ